MLINEERKKACFCFCGDISVKEILFVYPVTRISNFSVEASFKVLTLQK